MVEGAITAGVQFIGLCPPNCTFANHLEPVYGFKVYAIESSLCAAAQHLGICGQSAACEILVTVTGPEKSFNATKQHGIVSMAHGPAEVALSITHGSCTNSLIQKRPLKLKVHFGVHTVPLPQVSDCLYRNAAFTQTRSSWHQGWVSDNGAVKQRHGRFFFGMTSFTCGDLIVLFRS